MAEQNSEAKPISTGHLCPAFSLRRPCTCATRPYSPSPLLLCVDNSISYGIVGEWPTLSFSSKMKRFPDSFFAFEKLFFPKKLILRYFFIFIISFVPLSLLEEFRISGWIEFRIMEYVSRTDIYNNKLVSRKSWNTHSFPCVTLSSGGRVFSSNIRITHKSVRPGREWHASGALSLSLSLSATAINHNESVLPGEGSVFPRPSRAGPLPSPSSSPVARLFRARRLYNSISSPRHPSNSVSSFSWISRAVSARAKPGNGHARFNIIDAIRFDSIRLDSIRSLEGGRKGRRGTMRNGWKGGGSQGDFRILSGGLGRCIVCKTGDEGWRKVSEKETRVYKERSHQRQPTLKFPISFARYSHVCRLRSSPSLLLLGRLLLTDLSPS